jgi:hypothetical protein
MIIDFHLIIATLRIPTSNNEIMAFIIQSLGHWLLCQQLMIL